MQSFNGSTHFGTTPDADGLSFGNGTTDSAFSVVVLGNVTDTSAGRSFAGKYTANQREWNFNISASDLLRFDLFDESADDNPRCESNAAITHAATSLFAGTYTAATGGATAANDISLYVNGLAIASTATNPGSYTAMENGSSVVGVGARDNTGTQAFSGSEGLVLVCQKALSASEHWLIKNYVNAYFGLSL